MSLQGTEESHCNKCCSFSQRHFTSVSGCFFVCVGNGISNAGTVCHACQVCSLPHPNVVHLFVLLLASVYCWYRLVKSVFSVAVACLFLLVDVLFYCCQKKLLMLRNMCCRRRKVVVVIDKLLLHATGSFGPPYLYAMGSLPQLACCIPHAHSLNNNTGGAASGHYGVNKHGEDLELIHCSVNGGKQATDG